MNCCKYFFDILGSHSSPSHNIGHSSITSTTDNFNLVRASKYSAGNHPAKVVKRVFVANTGWSSQVIFM